MKLADVVRYFVSLLVWLYVGCGTQYVDPIVESSRDSSNDVCSQWRTLVDCNADTAHGCAFQPNARGCLSNDVDCGEGLCRGGDPFVRRLSQTLWLHGAPYRFLGAVSWGISGWGTGCWYASASSYEQVVDQTFDELTITGATVLRFWAFQSFSGTSGQDFSRIDRLVIAARRAGIRLIPVLENHWADCTEGGQKNDDWYASGYASSYGNYRLSYRDYVKAIVTRYRDEPTLLGWELVHESQGTDFASLHAFFDDMTQVVRKLDDNHLVIAGLDGGTSTATNCFGAPSNYQLLQARDEVDLIDVHDFNASGSTIPANFETLLGIASALEKPLFMGAVAVRLSDTTVAAYRSRAAIIEQKIEATEAAGSVGFLVYDYVPNWTEMGWSFDGRTQEPLAGRDGVLARHVPVIP